MRIPKDFANPLAGPPPVSTYRRRPCEAEYFGPPLCLCVPPRPHPHFFIASVAYVSQSFASTLSFPHFFFISNHHLLKYPSTSIHINLTYLSNMSRRLRSATISTKENVPDLAPPKQGRRASVHASSTPDFQVAEPVAPFTQANDTGNQEDGQTQVKYGPPKKKTAINAPANDAATQEVGKTQVKSGPPKKKTVAAIEGQRCPSNAQVFDGVHIQARVQLSRNVATEVAVRPANDPASEAAGHPDAVRSGVVGPGHVPHKSKPAPVLRTYGRKASSAQPTAPAAIAMNADNSDHTLSDLTPTRSDEDDIMLPDQPEGANSYSSFDVNNLPSTGRELTSIRDEDFHPRSLTIHDLDYDEVQEMREACESKHTAYCFSYADKTTQYYHGREITEGCQTAADWFTKYLDDNTKQWLPIPQGFTAPHLPEIYVDALNILREEDELHVNSYVIEAAMALDKTRNSGEDPFEILSLEDDLTWDDKNSM
ncbi:uncharacterized protein LACBIDRAFT_307826 [Laccaria bicolor S238N-H82]|uniref:Predicted protein n=1 Tax=Laccaria bicolor (strain S238N-H82 / ATCC MYA-4686) TaxID=486041 RepID=B0DR52_LACBS|nr:uncharacterized protein LACBIDRAFT_307826 [Laccaria bicolor S238N-H82]EDR02938.1 predicted protein [Laccaria bicolor S238N-H82]|eukprot:XP_001886361.1 predicted protein [Laccaria bicolor S238N-H82]